MGRIQEVGAVEASLSLSSSIYRLRSNQNGVCFKGLGQKKQTKNLAQQTGLPLAPAAVRINNAKPIWGTREKLLDTKRPIELVGVQEAIGQSVDD